MAVAMKKIKNTHNKDKHEESYVVFQILKVERVSIPHKEIWVLTCYEQKAKQKKTKNKT